MSGLNLSSEYSDVVNDSYISGSVSVTSTEIEAKVGGSRLAGREILTIYNSSTSVIYHGPTGVTTSTGVRIEKGQTIDIPVGDNIGVFLIAASGTNSVIVQEWS